MSETMIIAILAFLEKAVEAEPRIADSVKKIFSKGEPTPADWQAERDAVAPLTYQQLVPNSQLPKP